MFSSPVSSTSGAPATGIETEAPAISGAEADWRLPSPHFRLLAPVFRDQTDCHAELLQEREWLLQSAEAEVKLQGNVFVLESVLDGTGRIFLKIAPEPHARAVSSEWDFRVALGETVALQREDGYAWVLLTYQGGQWGRIAALHAWQRSLRPYQPGRDGVFLSNTWGDRSRDAHLSPQFMLREIEAAARLGVDVVQIDDGWQQGVSANSAQSNGSGAWDGFWTADPHFWAENRTRFPEGLRPLIETARARGIQFGLWFAPDSSQDAANWRRDADAILHLHRDLGICFIKVDGLKITSALGESRLRAFFEAVLCESGGQVTLDQDVTAEKRFGYFGLVEPGPLFVENRYTDWHRYWPHHTLRVAWKLAHWIDPLRLRLEWLNHSRNREKYGNDPLAPEHWSPDALFASVMFCSPLGWFEVQNLPSSYFEKAAPLIAKWKLHREAMARGSIFPVGAAPDGVSWTGFVSVDAEGRSGFALIFREYNPSATCEFQMPCNLPDGPCEVLGGEGRAEGVNGILRVEIPEKLRFVWVRF